ncbi:MAG: prepilin-type N-terminal cleavage/methylation domain-containing protein [Verrucomicrobiota bacterium JB024]|nr:prepilin-type N-terminal cleavage/methylation domain-containing protein [Verrucomicrobiota bacterium JB024]
MHTDSYTQPCLRVKSARLPCSKIPAFSLIELLTVIAIIGVLAAILVPIVGSVKASVRSTQCARRLSQIGSAIYLYTSDNNGYFPDVMVRSEANTYWHQWWREIGPYINTSVKEDQYSYEDLQCPEVTELAIESLPSSSRPERLPNYGLNAKLSRYQDNVNNAPAGTRVRVLDVVNPARTLLVGDVGVGGTSTVPGMDVNSVTNQGDKHPGGSNLLWVDGHVSVWKDVNRLREAPYAPGSTEDVWNPY